MKRKCKTCDKPASPLYIHYCDECQSIGAFFQYEMNHLWKVGDTEKEFTMKLDAWKQSLTEEERQYIIRNY